MKLDVLVCCYNESIKNIDKLLLSPRIDVQYIISHQCDSPAYYIFPDFLDRRDVRFVRSIGKGLSKNRNIALKNASSTICLIADDDVKYTHQDFDTILDTYRAQENKDVIVFKIRTQSNEPAFKEYPTENYSIQKRNYKHYISSIEISFKREGIMKNNIFFDERFGLGSKYFSMGGEDEILINDCLKKKLNVFFVNKFIVEHPYLSTGKTILQKSTFKKVRHNIAFSLRNRGFIYFFYLLLHYKRIVSSLHFFKVLSVIFSVSYVLLIRKRFNHSEWETLN